MIFLKLMERWDVGKIWEQNWIWMPLENFIGYKLSTQSLVLGNKCFTGCGINISNVIINESHLIKKHQIYCWEKLNSRELYNMQLILSK